GQRVPCRTDWDVDLPHHTVPVFRDSGELVARQHGQVARATRQVARDAGFTLLQIIAVVAIIAVLVAAIVPTIIRRVDRAAWTAETANLNTIANSFTQSILRTKKIPDATGWASFIATNEASFPVSSNLTNSRR